MIHCKPMQISHCRDSGPFVRSGCRDFDYSHLRAARREKSNWLVLNLNLDIFSLLHFLLIVSSWEIFGKRLSRYLGQGWVGLCSRQIRLQSYASDSIAMRFHSNAPEWYSQGASRSKIIHTRFRECPNRRLISYYDRKSIRSGYYRHWLGLLY